MSNKPSVTEAYSNLFKEKGEITMLNLKNKTEREAFVSGYKNWTDGKGKRLDVWKSVPELDLQFYRYGFGNGAALIVTEYMEYKTAYKDYKTAGQEYVSKHKFCLILPENDDYFDASSASGRTYRRTYTLEGCSIGTVVDYLTKNKLYI